MVAVGAVGVNSLERQPAGALEVSELKKQRKSSAVVTFSCKSQHLSGRGNDGFQMARDAFPWVGGAGGRGGAAACVRVLSVCTCG